MDEKKPEREHIPDETCWCKPTVTKIGGSAATIVHKRQK